jgi:hypothetical protein
MIGLNVHGSDLLAAPDQTPRTKKRSGHRSWPVASASAVGSGRVPSQSQACRGRELLSRPPAHCALRSPAAAGPLGFLRLGGRETWPCRGAAQRRFAVACCAAPRAHGGSRGRAESRAGIQEDLAGGIFRLFTCWARCSPPANLPPLRAIRLPFQLFPCSVGVACVWQPCDGRSMDRMALCVCRSKGASSCPGGMAWTQSLFLDTR